jgi:hypothetical protein
VIIWASSYQVFAIPRPTNSHMVNDVEMILAKENDMIMSNRKIGSVDKILLQEHLFVMLP